MGVRGPVPRETLPASRAVVRNGNAARAGALRGTPGLQRIRAHPPAFAAGDGWSAGTGKSEERHRTEKRPARRRRADRADWTVREPDSMHAERRPLPDAREMCFPNSTCPACPCTIAPLAARRQAQRQRKDGFCAHSRERAGAHAPPPSLSCAASKRHTAMPAFRALSARFWLMPEPGNTMTPSGMASSIASLRRKGAALPWRVQSGR